MILRKNGFTLIEIIIALAMILTIISMVYATYWATAQSIDRCNAKIASARQARSLLAKMTRQIRCLYPVPNQGYSASVPKTSANNTTNNNAATATIPYFLGGVGRDDNIILRLVSTAEIFRDKIFPNGPFDIAYKYDRLRGILYYSQRKYVTGPENDSQEKNWFPLAQNVASIELAFHDGRSWRENWNLNSKRPVPLAVKIKVVFTDEKPGSIGFTSTAYINCNNKGYWENGT